MDVITQRDTSHHADSSAVDIAKLRRVLAEVLTQLGSGLVNGDLAGPRDIPIEFEGAILGFAKLPSITAALPRLVRQLEREFGRRLPELSRTEKQQAVQRFVEEGAMELREAVDRIAGALGVSRVTVYSYLNRHGR